MLALTKRKTTAPTEDDARAAFTNLGGQRRALITTIEGLEAAIALDNLGSDEQRASDRFAVIRQKAEPFAGMRRRKLDRLLADAEDELQALLPKWMAARDAAQRADARDRRAKAARLAPEHRAIVNRIADALEALAAAVGEEADLRRQVMDPHGNVPDALPDMHFANIGSPADHHSPVSEWFRRARRNGFLE